MRHESFVARADARLFVVEQGPDRPDVPALVLLHGGLADHHASLRLAGDLGARLRLVTPDVRGAGRSHHAGPLDWDQLADDVVAVIHALCLRRAFVGGTSFGSGLAVRVALRHPEVVTGLVLVSPAFAGEDRGYTPAQATAMSAMARAGHATLVHGVRALHPLLDGLPEPLRTAARPIVDAYDPASVAATTAFMAYGPQPFARVEDLSAIACPTLVLPGTDETHPTELATLYARHLRRCTVGAPDDPPAAIAAFVEATRGSPSGTIASSSTAPPDES